MAVNPCRLFMQIYWVLRKAITPELDFVIHQVAGIAIVVYVVW